MTRLTDPAPRADHPTSPLLGVLHLLRCPGCGSGFALVRGGLRCDRGHCFDIARQGYANLTGAAQPGYADSPAMVAARAEFLGSGRYAAVVAALAAALPDRAARVLDVGTGTGHYAAAALESVPTARGLGLDVSVAACRRAARAHPRLGVITADVRQPLPLAGRSVDVVLSVFAPRSAAEFARVLRPGGVLITVTPAADHLVELRADLGLMAIADDKRLRLAEAFRPAGLAVHDEATVRRRDAWTSADALRMIMMGPNAFHLSADEARRAVSSLTWPRPTTISCTITRWARSPAG